MTIGFPLSLALSFLCKHAEPAIYAPRFWHKLLFRRSALFHRNFRPIETFGEKKQRVRKNPDPLLWRLI
jgi:hypothetical protein